IAVSAGIGVALSGAVALTDSHPSEVSARISGSASVTVTGAVTLNAVSKAQSRAEAFGVSIAGGAALGLSYAQADDEVNVIAAIGNGATFNAGSLSVTASLDLPGGAHPKNAYANAVAGGGGLLLGAAGAIARATAS